MWKDNDSTETVEEDLWGEILWAYWRGEPAAFIIRRDDGLADDFPTPAGYFEESLNPFEQKYLQYFRCRILDLGCGPGRALLYLQKQGFTVTGIDISPLTVELARLRGACDVRVMSVNQMTFPPDSFDTVLLFGNNLDCYWQSQFCTTRHACRSS